MSITNAGWGSVSPVATGGIAHVFDTATAYAGGKLASFQTNTVEKAYVSYLGGWVGVTGVFSGMVTASVFSGPIGTGTATPAAVSATTGTFSTSVHIGAADISQANLEVTGLVTDVQDIGGVATIEKVLLVRDSNAAAAWYLGADNVAGHAYLWSGTSGKSVKIATRSAPNNTVVATFGANLSTVLAGTCTSAGILSTTDATDASSATAASLKTAGGLSTVKGIWSGSFLYVATTSQLVGNVGIGAASSANADLLLEAGRLMLKESATPTADTNYGKIYTKTDDMLYFQDGSGVEHPIQHSDVAGIHYTTGASAVVPITLADVYTKLTDFTTNGPNVVSTSDQANNRIVIGASRVYASHVAVSGEVTGSAALFEVSIINIAQGTTAITGISEATPGVVSTAGHSFTDGQLVKITGVVGMVEVNDRVFKVAAADATTFALTTYTDANVATGGYTSWSSGGTIQLATEITEINRDFPNGSVGASGTSFPFNGVAGDFLEVYAKNEDNTNEIDFTQCHFWIDGK